MCQKVIDQTKTIITDSSKTESYHVRRRNFQSKRTLRCEDGNSDMSEIILKPSSVYDNKPLHIGISILQYSKLLMLEFVAFLNEFLVKDSFSLVYTG